MIFLLICTKRFSIISFKSLCDSPPDKSNNTTTTARATATSVMPYLVTNGSLPPISRSTSGQ